MTKWLLWLVLVNMLTVWTPLVSETAVDKPFDYLAGVQSDDASLCMVYVSTNTCPIAFFADGKDLLKENAAFRTSDEDGRVFFDASDIKAFEQDILAQLEQKPFFRYAADDNSYLGQVALEKIRERNFWKNFTWQDFVEGKEIYCNRQGLLPTVNHRRYAIDEQEMIPPEYIGHLEELLADNGLSQTPPVITEIWQVDLDGDGKQEVFVKSCNSNDNWRTSEDEIAQSVDYDLKNWDGIGTYLVLSLYSETLGQAELDEFYAPIIDNGYKAFSRQKVLQQLQEDMAQEDDEQRNYEDWIELADRQYQYDDEGVVRLMPVYASGETCNLSCDSCQMLFFDANDDGLYDFILRTGMDYKGFALYLTSPNQLQYEYELITGP